VAENDTGEVYKLFCKDCFYFNKLKVVDRAVCTRTGLSVEDDDRPCDSFIMRGLMADEWGQSPCGEGSCR